MRKWPVIVALVVFLAFFICNITLLGSNALRDNPETLGRVVLVDTPFYLLFSAVVCFLPVWGILTGVLWLKDKAKPKGTAGLGAPSAPR